MEFALDRAALVRRCFSGIITLGIGVFYQQQLSNAAREAARYAAIHSATSQCPTTSWMDPNLSRVDPTLRPERTDYDCDPPDLRWPQMTALRTFEQVFGLNRERTCTSPHAGRATGTTTRRNG